MPALGIDGGEGDVEVVPVAQLTLLWQLTCALCVRQLSQTAELLRKRDDDREEARRTAELAEKKLQQAQLKLQQAQAASGIDEARALAAQVRDIPSLAQTTPPHPTPPHLSRLHSTLDSTRLDSTQLNSTQLNSTTRLDSTQLDST